MKKSIKTILQKIGIYDQLKYLPFFQLCQSILKPAVARNRRRELNFYESFLKDCALIFDIGANNGDKTHVFLNISKIVVCCEPDPANFVTLKTRFRYKKRRVIIENVALSDKTETTVMYLHHPGSAFNTLSDKWKKILEEDDQQRWNESIQFTRKQTVATTTLDNLIGKYGLPDFIKIDAEGFEETILNGLSHPIPFISFETLLPDYSFEFTNCLDKIETLSYKTTFNIALHEKLLLPGFTDRIHLEEWLLKNPQSQGFEVIAKMETRLP
jgi:FkbM family methyltransferase